MDYFSLIAACRETGDRFTGRKIRGAAQVSAEEVILSFGREGEILLSAAPARPGLFLLPEKISREPFLSPFNEIFSSRIRGAALVSLSMPDAGERIVFLHFQPGWPGRAGEEIILALEVMGRRSNMALVEKGRILAPLRPVPAEKSPRRPFLPGLTWKLPPPRPGKPPEQIMVQDLPELHGRSRPELIEALAREIKGLSPFTANQILLRASDGEATSILQILRETLDAADGSRGWLYASGGKTWLCPFQPVIPEGERGEVQPFQPFSAASWAWLQTDTVPEAGGNERDGQLLADLEQEESRLEKTLSFLVTEEERCATHEELRTKGQALLIHASGIPAGASSVALANPFDPEKTLLIDLDPAFSPGRNADHYFREARRLSRGLEEISRRRAAVEKDLGRAKTAREALLEKGDPDPAIALLQKDPRPKGSGGSRPAPFKGPGRRHIFGGFTILVGKSALDNERVTFQAAGPEDLWLHARDCPGSHVVILAGRQKVPEEVVRHAASLAMENSGARRDTAPEIMVAQRKWVRKIKGGKPGKVTVQNFRTIRVRKRD
ncbi:MAG: NFACT family protein [Proteobacteria bacterium]|nr:NFACT family protein [Pseudomonadota bacterium]